MSASRANFLGARVALLFGNFITGLAVLAPTGMLQILSEGLTVSIRDVGLLVTYGAIVLCFASPLVSWASNRLDRRSLLTVVLLIIAAAHLVSAMTSSYAAVLLARLTMLLFAAVFTPQAAGTIALMASDKERAGAIAFVFIGWSLSVAVGLPLVTLLATQFGWQSVFLILGLAAAVCALFIWRTLPGDLRAASFSLASWGEVFHNRLIVLLLLITAVQVGGQFLILTYFGPLLTTIAGAGAREVAVFFAIFGFCGLAGSILTTRIVGRLGAFVTSGLALGAVLAGVTLWSFGGGVLALLALGAAIWGLGFAAANSMQQARLYVAAPALASVSVALNTSAIYVGQAAGSWIGGLMFARSLAETMGHAAALIVLASLGLWWLTRPPRQRSGASGST